jgi:CDP-6-deoxy-D-xylo-4-hexulose-3-dehydrase
MINLVKDTIDNKDISDLIEWLKTNQRLTKGDLTDEFERQWSEWLGVKHSIYVNSGSSANLAIFTALKYLGRINGSVVAPAVSWATTVAPLMQLGFDVTLCDCDRDTLGLDTKHLREICEEKTPSMIVLVHVLGIPCDMDEVMAICKEYGAILVEDSCESVGSAYNGKTTGTFGLASSFSFYAGHIISTIEGGMICTDDDELHETIKSIRCHGWDRDLQESCQKKLRAEYGIDDFRALYSFYWKAYNFRATDLQAHIGLSQMKKIDSICEQRHENLLLYDKLIKNDFWKLPIKQYITNFAYPIITPKISDVVSALRENNIETRPLVCGSIGRQPFWIKEYGETRLPFADIVHDYGLYVPNNHQITAKEITKICEVINSV